MNRFCPVVVSWLAIFASLSLAQTGTTSLRGLIVDKTGAAIAGAKVTVSNGGQGLERQTESDSSGEYRIRRFR